MSSKRTGKKVPAPVVPGSDSPGGPAAEDADEILDLALRIVRMDLETIDADPRAKVDTWRAMAVSNYIRALGAVSKARNPASGTGKMGRLGMEELIEEALKTPELREALRRGMD